MKPVSQSPFGFRQIEREADQHGLAGNHRAQDNAKDGLATLRVGGGGVSGAFS